MPARDRRPVRRDFTRPAPRPAAPPSADRRSSDQRSWEEVPPEPPRPGVRRPERAPEESEWQRQLRSSTVLTRALLPLRFFVGATFLYAGIDKLTNPLFLRATGPGSIGQQLAAFERVSPIAGLVHLADPFPVLVGLLIALLEIAIGLGAVLGLLFRWAAFAGAALAFLFFLTASWGTQPYYYGPDLPYMFGWITLALAGHGHLFTLEDWLERRDAARAAAAAAWPPRATMPSVRRSGSATPPMFTDPERRAFLQLGVLAVATVALATFAGMWGLRERAEAGDGGTGLISPSAGASPQPTAADASPSAGASPSAAASATVAPSAGATAAANQVGTLADLKSQGALLFQDPSSGDPVIVVPSGSSAIAYDAVCTHQGCTVEYDPQNTVRVCPCHGAEFDPAHDGAVLAGPARRPLTKYPIVIQNGAIYLKA